MLAACILVLGILSRLVVHSWNFTPVIALALFGGVYLKKKQAIILPLVLFAVTDMILGFHQVMFFTWGSVVLISAMGLWVQRNKNLKTVLGGGLASAVLFFVVTNFGVWLVSGMYPLTLAGLSECFTLAVPFFRGTLLGTFVYGFVLFGVYEIIAARIKSAKLSHVL
ncbi:MAG: hypothetical protein KAR32_04790 [Candidatus Omnitrophica bacterium]|nr:hypothetical protein [Candidatus Omnitrophota bacterium]MCK5260310.1 hypothetical protein [Candidatus Omnitrophota bacterium]